MFSNLVLSGGAIKGFSFIGVIRFLEEKGCLEGIKTYVGSSAGSIICFLLAIGYPSDNIYLICLEIYKMYTVKPINIDSILNLNQTLGVEDGAEIIHHLRESLFSKYGVRSISFLDLCKRSGLNLVICASNLSKGKTTFFSVNNTPDVCVVDAVRASITIPLIFTPIEIDGDLFVDAALYNNFPVDYIHNFVLKDTLGVLINSKKYQPAKPLHLIPYMRLIIDSMLDLINNKNELMNMITLIEIDESDDTFAFDMSTLKLGGGEDNVEKYYLNGYESAEAKFKDMESVKNKTHIAREKSFNKGEIVRLLERQENEEKEQKKEYVYSHSFSYLCSSYANDTFNRHLTDLLSGNI